MIRASWRVGRARALATVVVLLAMGSTTLACAQSTLLSARQTRPGEFVARVAVDSSIAPQPAEFQLQLASGRAVAASGTTPAPLTPESTALLICIDQSGSMGAAAVGSIRDVLRTTLVPRRGESRLPVSVALVAFGTRTTHLLALSSDPAQVAAAVDRLTLERGREGRTRLYDAVAGGLAELRASGAVYQRLLVVSDGNDEGSSLSQQALIQRMGEPTSIAIDAVGFGALAASASGSLSTLAGATNGKFSVADTRPALAASIEQMIRQFVPRPAYDVAFRYVPADDQRRSEAPMLIYRAPGGAPQSMPIAVDVAAASVDASPGGTTGPGADAGAVSGARSNGVVGWIVEHAISVRWMLIGLPKVAWIAAAGLLLLLVLSGMFWWSRRRVDPPIVPVPQPIFPDPLDRTVGPDARPDLTVDFKPGPGPQPASRRRVTQVSHHWPSPMDGRAVAWLHGMSGAAQGRRFRVSDLQTRLGAAPDNDIVVADDDFVSSHHAVLKLEANGLYLVDLGSRNGSRLNGEKFAGSTRSLSPGDRVTLGRTEFEVMTADVQAARSEYETRVR